MRASRLLRILLILQNRGRRTSTELAQELEVAPRTILRDVDAMTEAGLPVLAHAGRGGGIELGFNYRTRLTGLDTEEAEALGLLLSAPSPAVVALGLGEAAIRARAKLIESLPDTSRRVVAETRARFVLERSDVPYDDPRVAALANAIRGARRVRIRARSAASRVIHPIAMRLAAQGWAVVDQLDPDHPIPLVECGDLTISAHRFER